MYDKGFEFIGHEFKNPLIQEEFGMNANPTSLRNPTSNKISERIQSILGNLVHTYNPQNIYVDEDEPCMGILVPA